MQKRNTNEEIIIGKYNPLNILFYKKKLKKIKSIQEKMPNKEDIKHKELNAKLKILEKYLN